MLGTDQLILCEILEKGHTVGTDFLKRAEM